MRHTMISLAVLAAVATVMTACGGQDIEAYTSKDPQIRVQDFYGKPMGGYGMFQDGSGQVSDRYFVTLVPQWQGNDGTLTEKQWNDKGELFFTQTWHIHVGEDGRDFTGTGTRADGTIEGMTRGNAMHMQYTLLSPKPSGGDIALAADDWTYLQPDGSGINQVALSKYGYHVGDVTYVLHPLDPHHLPQGYSHR